MKKITLIVSMITLCVGFSSTASAQVTASAKTDANIVKPILISKITDMNFGDIAVTGSIAADIIMNTAGARTAATGIKYPVTGGNTAAKFTVTGEPDYAYTILLPSSIILTTGVGGANQTMTVDAFTRAFTAGGTDTTGNGTLSADVTGTQDVFVGATLNVLALQEPGLYTNTSDFTMTVNYN